MSLPPPSLVGSVVERNADGRNSKPVTSLGSSTGFPAVQHRSKSAFARARDAKRNGGREGQSTRTREVPIVLKSDGWPTRGQDGEVGEDGGGLLGKEVELPDPGPSTLPHTNNVHTNFVSDGSPSKLPYTTADDWKKQMSQDNDRAIGAMTEEERERHRAEVFEQLGPNVAELLRQAGEARNKGKGVSKVEPISESYVGSTVPSGLDGHKALASSDEETGNTEQSKKRQRDEEEVLQPTPLRSHTLSKLVTPHRGILISNASPPASRSSTPGRALRKLRFADVTPKDIHIFASEPSSPRRPIGLLLPPPAEVSDEDIMSVKSNQRAPELDLIEDIRRSHFGALRAQSQALSNASEPEAEEGTPEDIRRRYFPHIQPHDPSLEWIEGEDSSSISSDADPEPRFNLSGAVIPPEQRASLPTHLGLHHHAGSASLAGYTLADLYHLARSSVPAQRATIIGVLAKIVRRVARFGHEVEEIHGRRDELRKNALAAGLEALAEKGTMVVQAIDLLWTCVVDWEQESFDGLEGVELRPLCPKARSVEDVPSENETLSNSLSSADPLSTLPLSALLPQLVAHFTSASLPLESHAQLLAITHRLVRHSVAIATSVVETPNLIGSIVSAFLLTPIPPLRNGPFPNPLALQFLQTLTLSSRANARTLTGPADALLRFITTSIPPSNSPFPQALAEDLLCGTLDLYSSLATYGLYTGIATTAAEHFSRLSVYVFSPENLSRRLTLSWLRLLNVWMVAARDPHRTTPAHDLLWSQMKGWAWGDDLLVFRQSLLHTLSNLNEKRRNVDFDPVWGGLWDAIAAWVEGCRVNNARSGQTDRQATSSAVDNAWKAGAGAGEKEVLTRCIIMLRGTLSTVLVSDPTLQELRSLLSRLAGLCRPLTSFVRLCLALVGDVVSKADLSPDEALTWVREAFEMIGPVAHDLLSHSVWRWNMRTPTRDAGGLLPRFACALLRPLSAFVAAYSRLSMHFLGSRRMLFSIATLQRLLPGDETDGQWVIEEIIKAANAEEGAERPDNLFPFFLYSLRPKDDVYLSPCSPTPQSLQMTTTQCLPGEVLSSIPRQSPFGLPFKSDWPSVALDHLLRSGSSAVLTNPDSLPSSWNASETDLVRGSLSLCKFLQDNLLGSEFHQFAMNREQMVFVCMKIFMLEHDQQENDSGEDVFRDSHVGKLMDELLGPFTLGNARNSSALKSGDLEEEAKDFLGPGTPFYQFYTDFVALYDSISFSHPTFARLLIVPTSMAYALDYRKLLWGDFGHILRTVKTQIANVIVDDLNTFLWPFESDAGMIGWYLRALVKWTLDGFPHFLAVHHIACNIWPDLQEGPVREKRAKMLLLAIVNQALPEVIKDVVRYTQVQGSPARVPPQCYSCDEDRKVARLRYVGEWGGPHMMGRLEKIFEGGGS